MSCLWSCGNAERKTSSETDSAALPHTAHRSLHVHKVFWSRKPSTLPVTVFAGLTLSRLDALEAQCRSWRGPHASAVYVPLVQQQSGLQLTGPNKQKLSIAEQAVQSAFAR